MLEQQWTDAKSKKRREVENKQTGNANKVTRFKRMIIDMQ
jgi:hypothetical protein